MQVAGPRWMAKREAFNVKPLVQLYNVCMVVANLYFMIQFLRHSYLGGGYNIFCQGESQIFFFLMNNFRIHNSYHDKPQMHLRGVESFWKCCSLC